MQRWTCPSCGFERESFSLPNHKHDGDWVAFIPAEPPQVAAKRGRPRKQPES